MAQYKDYYKTLGVKRNANKKEIKRVYRILARQYHPDLNPGDKQAEERFKEINEAYEVLGDPEKRTRYDGLGISLSGETIYHTGGVGVTPNNRTQATTWNPFSSLSGEGGPLGGFFHTTRVKPADTSTVRDVPPRRAPRQKVLDLYIPDAFQELIMAIELVTHEGKNNLIVVKESRHLQRGFRRFTCPIWRVSKTDEGEVRVAWSNALFESYDNKNNDPQTHELSTNFEWRDINGMATQVHCSEFYEQLRGYIRCLIRFIREVDIRDNQDFLRELERYNDALKDTNRFGAPAYCRFNELPLSLRDRSMHFYFFLYF